MSQHAAKTQPKDNPKSLSIVKKNAISPKNSGHQQNAHTDMMPHISASSYPDVPLSPENIIFLQQTAGNQAVDQWVQTKLHDEKTETTPKQGIAKESDGTRSKKVASDKLANELSGGAKSSVGSDAQSEKSVGGDLATDATTVVPDPQKGLQDKEKSENRDITADDSKQLSPLTGDSASAVASEKDAPSDGEIPPPPDKQVPSTGIDDANAAPSSQSPSNRIDSDKSPTEGNIAEQSLEVPATEAGGIGGGGRMTEMVDASKDGGVELMQAKTLQAKGTVSGQLMGGSQSAVKKSKAKIKQLSTNEKKKESAEKKLGDSMAAVVENKEDKQAEVQTQKAGAMDEMAAPQVEASNSEQALRNKLSAALPTDLEGATEFKKRGKGVEVGAMVSQVIKVETEVVEKNYQEIETLPPVAEPKASVSMPDIEAPVETGALTLSAGIVPEVSQTQSDLSEFKDESDKLLEREGITEEQLAMVDSGDLAEAKKQRGEVDSKVKTAPSEAKSFEKKQRKQLDSDLAKEENQGKKAMRDKRVGMLTEAKKRQLKTTSDLQARKDRVTRDIQAKYQAAEEKVKTKLATLESKSLSAFDALQKQATQEFENNVESRLNIFKDQRYGGFWGGAKWLKDKILGMDDLPEVKRIFDEEKGSFISKMDQAIAQLIDASKSVIQECRDIISQTRKDIDIYVNGLGPALKSTGEKAQSDIKNKLDKLDKDVTEAANALEQKLIAKRAAAIKAIEEKIENMKAEMSGLLAQIGSFLLDAMLKFFKWALGKFGYSPDQIMGILNKGKSVITAVVTDPVQFIKNMIGAVKGGINNFKNNIKKHLIGGLISWLTGAMGDLPIQIPSEFSLKGILSLVMQILGLTWDRLRLKLVKRVGEPIVKVAESGVDIVQRLISGGPMALWEMVKEKAAEIKQTVMESIRNWVIVQLVKQAIIKLLSFLNPAGAIVQAILAIYNTIMFFVENIQRIIEMVKSIFNSIGAIAAGQVSAAAAFVERSMAMAIPVILAFLARLMNISGIGKAIRKIMKKIRKPIDKVVNKALDFIAKKARKLFGKKGGKKGDAKKIKEDNKKGKEGKISAKDKRMHQKIAGKIESKLKQGGVKENESFVEFHSRKKKEGEILEDKYQSQIKKGINLDIIFQPLNKDKVDNDLDVRIRIFPNNVDETEELNYSQVNDEFEKLRKEAKGGKGFTFTDIIKKVNDIKQKTKITIKRTTLSKNNPNWEFILHNPENDKIPIPITITRDGPKIKAPEETLEKLTLRLKEQFTKKSESGNLKKLGEVEDKLNKMMKCAGSKSPSAINQVGVLLEEIQHELLELIGTAKGYPKPKYIIPTGIASDAEATYLSVNRVMGQKPSSDPRGWKHLQKSLTKGGGRFVRMHLINMKFGGPGTTGNLVPGAEKYNSQTENNFDSKIKEKIGPQPLNSSEINPNYNHVVWIKAKVNYFGDDKWPESNLPPEIDGEETPKTSWFAKTIEFTSGDYDKKDDSWIINGTATLKDVLKMDLPQWDAEAILSLRYANTGELIKVAADASQDTSSITKLNMRILRELVFKNLVELNQSVMDYINDTKNGLKKSQIPSLLLFTLLISKLVNEEEIGLSI